MQALSPRTKAPDLALSTVTGKPFVLSEALIRGPVVLAFFKVSCPTCQYAFPYLDRISRAHKTEPVTFVGISQNDLKDTEAFIKEYGVTFPVLLEDTKRYKVSNSYGLTNVPTVFLISREQEIEMTIVGWSRAEVEELNLRISMMSPDQQTVPIFKPGEQVAEYKAG
jgi:peroxiredoxin